MHRTDQNADTTRSETLSWNRFARLRGPPDGSGERARFRYNYTEFGRSILSCIGLSGRSAGQVPILIGERRPDYYWRCAGLQVVANIPWPVGNAAVARE